MQAFFYPSRTISNSLFIMLPKPKIHASPYFSLKNSLQQNRHTRTQDTCEARRSPNIRRMLRPMGHALSTNCWCSAVRVRRRVRVGPALACIWAPLVRSVCSCPFVAERKGDQTRGDHALHALLRVRGSCQCIFFCVSCWKTTKIGT